MQRSKQVFLKLFKAFVFAAIMFLGITLLASLVVQLPVVQSRLIRYVSENIYRKTSYPVSIEQVRFVWLDKVAIRKLQIDDLFGLDMVRCDEILVDFSLWELLKGNPDRIDFIELSDPRVKLAYHKEKHTLNLDDFLLALTWNDTSQSEGKPSRPFVIGAITIGSGYFSFEDELAEVSGEKFDENHFTLSRINGHVEQLEVWGDSIQLEVTHLNCLHDASGLKTHNLRTRYTYSEHYMVFDRLRLEAGNSVLGDSIVFFYHDFSDFKHFNQLVYLYARLEETSLDTRDLGIFNSFFDTYRDVYEIQGIATGNVSKLSLKDTKLEFGLASELRGNFSLFGLPDIEETLLDLDVYSLAALGGDLVQYVGYEESINISKLGKLTGKAGFTGFYYDFVAKASLQTDLGYLSTDIQLKLDGADSTMYKGSLLTERFNIGRWIDRESLTGKVSMNGTIEGTGVQLKFAKFKLNATVSELELLDYQYHNIQVDAALSKSFFDGTLHVNDTNLVLHASGKVNLESGSETIDLKGSIVRANVQKLAHLKTHAGLSMQFVAHTKGLSVDDFTGSILLEKIRASYENNVFQTDTVSLRSSEEKGTKELKVDGSFGTVTVKGEYKISEVVADFGQTLQEYMLAVLNDRNAQVSYYAKKNYAGNSYRADVVAVFKDINPMLALFTDQITIAPGARAEGSIQTDQNRQIQLYCTADSMRLGRSIFEKNSFDIYTSKSVTSPDLLVMVNGQSGSQRFPGMPATEDLLLEAIWQNNMLEFNTHLEQSGEPNAASLEGNILFLDSGYLLSFEPSHFKVLDKVWSIKKGNQVRVEGLEVTTSGVELISEGQSILLAGTLSEDSTKFMDLSVRGFSVDQLSPLLGVPLSGALHSSIRMYDMYHSRNIRYAVEVDSLIVGRFYTGDVQMSGNWENAQKAIQVGLHVLRNKQTVIALNGYVNPLLGEQALNLQLVFKEAGIGLLEPFFQSYISEVKGNLEGAIRMTGSITRPVLKGKAFIKDAQLKVNYLNTSYSLTDSIYFEENEIGMRNTLLMDERGGKAMLRRATLYHEGFSQWWVEVAADVENFLVLDKKEDLDDYYFGTAIVSGKLGITGPVQNIVMKANAVTNKGTKLYIPVGGTEVVEQQEFISFVNPLQKEKQKEKVKEKADLSGIEMDFNLNFTPDAQIEIIFDKRAGDIIKGNGKGKIQLLIDTRGDFSMLGNYEILNGTYNFTFLNVVNKKFDIRAGSQINWSGDPFGAQLDIKASYTQNVSLLPILGITDSSIIRQPEIRRRYPTELFLLLSGPLLSPSFKFDIKISNFPQNIVTPVGSYSLNNAVMAFYSNIQNNEQEMNRQVFSLIALRRLSPDNTFAGSGQLVGNSLSELLSNQLSSWVSQVNDNLEIDFDLNGLSADALSTMQLRFSYSLLNGKIRVTRDGTFTNNQNQASFNSIVGDWMVEYMIDDYGRFRIKAFNRNNYNVLSSNINNTSTAGVSFLHTEAFDKLSELIRKKRIEEAGTGEPEEKPEEQNEEGRLPYLPDGFAPDAARKEEEPPKL
jgi:hypothetical protein